MSLSSGASFAVSSIVSVLIFSAMMVFAPWLAASKLNTLLGGYLGSWLFFFSLVAFGNIETIIFGASYHTKLFPEAALCLLNACLVAGVIHRVCATACFIFSGVALYYLDIIARKDHGRSNPSPIVEASHTSKKKNK